MAKMFAHAVTPEPLRVLHRGIILGERLTEDAIVVEVSGDLGDYDSLGTGCCGRYGG